LLRATIETNKVKWNEECQKSFDELKNLLTSDLVLQLPDFSKPFRLDTDACNYGVGEALEQPINSNSKEWKPVAYFSKHLSETQQKYSTTERELLAIVLACEHFRQMLYGVQFHVVTDHQPLKSILTSSNLSPRISRWLTRLKMFDPIIIYKEGIKHGNADGLSRMAVEETYDEIDNTPSTPINLIDVNELSDNELLYDKEEIEFNDKSEINIDLEMINVINLKSELIDLEQHKDENIVWIYNIIKKDIYEGKETSNVEFQNKEQENYFRQKHRLRIVNKQVYRDYIDENESVVLQYVVPKHIRKV
jgi:hypothetical protein